MADRRRINGPAATTQLPTYEEESMSRQHRNRNQAAARPFYLKTGVTPSASGSAYLEVEESPGSASFGMKLTCTVHGPRSLARSTPFSPHMVLSTHVKYAPFATRRRKGYLRDAGERDLSVHLETALRGAIIANRWPKSGVDVVVTIIEGEMACETNSDKGHDEWNLMIVLGGCITVASAAIADAGIECVDTVTGGVSALVADQSIKAEPVIVIDPVLSEHETILAACCIAYSARRDEITDLWYQGSLASSDSDLRRTLIARAIMASTEGGKIVASSLLESLTPP